MKLEELLETAHNHCLLDRAASAAPLLVGVSGGPDSLCLLDGLARLGFPLIAAHFDHRLRPDSGQDADQVRRAAEKLGVPFISGSADVSAYARAERLSIEEAARLLRYRFLFEQARRSAAQAVAVGHTADDQVETVLMHLLRGAGLNGLKGMSFQAVLPDWDVSIPLVRPLLGFWRAETLAYCQERGLQPVIDPTNASLEYSRNRLRHELIPLLETYNPRVRQNLWNTARRLAGDEAIVQAAVETAWQACRAGAGEGYLALSRTAFLALPAGLRRGVFRRAVAELRSSLRDVDFETVERALAFARQPTGPIDLVQGLVLFAEGERLLIAQGLPAADLGWPQLEQEMELPVPGELDLGSGWRLSSEWAEREAVPVFDPQRASPWEAWLDAGALAPRLCLRAQRPGDRLQPLGMEGRSLKLSDFWINQKLPRRARSAWPLLVSADTIAWVPGYRLAHPFRVQEHTTRVLHLRLFKTVE